MMKPTKFSRREVERSFRKFRDIIDDLLSAKHQTWDDSFTHLIVHCEQDTVMQVVTEPLRNNPNVDVEKWYTEFAQSCEMGDGQYRLPVNDDDRTALLYRFLLKIQREEVDFTSFCFNAFHAMNYDQMVHDFNTQLLSKFARDVSYRLDEIIEDTSGENEVSREALFVFQNFGGIHGSNLAIENSRIDNSSANITEGATGSELVQILQQAKLGLKQLPPEEQKEAEEYIDAIVEEEKTGGSLAKTKAFAKALLPHLIQVGEKVAVAYVKSKFGLPSGAG